MTPTEFVDCGTDSEGWHTWTLGGRVKLVVWSPWEGGRYMWECKDVKTGVTSQNGTCPDRSLAEKRGKSAAVETWGDLLLDDQRLGAKALAALPSSSERASGAPAKGTKAPSPSHSTDEAVTATGEVPKRPRRARRRTGGTK